MTEELETKGVDQMQAQTVQARGRDEDTTWGRMPLLLYMARAGEVISPWWSKSRDYELDRYWKGSDHISGAFYTLASKLSSVPFQVMPRDPAVAGHRKLADEYQENLMVAAEFGQGWEQVVVPFLIDLWSQDNGGFLEIIGGGPKDGELRGLPVGLAHLDSYRCHRTGSVEYPVQYEDTDGKLYKLHRSRVLFRSQMPSPRAEMYRVGFCWLSRCINTAQNLIDIATYKQEKLGSRPQRGLIVTRGGLDPEDLASAFMQADTMMDSLNLSRYSKFVGIGDRTLPEAGLDIIDLASLPDGFDEHTAVTLGMYAIALAGAVPPRWLWPATATGATKADAMYQHVAGLTGGPGSTLNMIAVMLGGGSTGGGLMPGAPRFLPPQLYLEFDFQDDEQDRTAAEIEDLRAQSLERELNVGAIDVRTAREKMLEDGDLTDAQFRELELNDGRLEDGLDVLTLFYSTDSQIKGLLAVDAEGEPLDVAANDAESWLTALDKQVRIAQEVAANGTNPGIRRKARTAIAALERLRGLYEEASKPEPEPLPEAPPPLEIDETTQEQGEETELEEDEELEEVEKATGPFEMKDIGSFRTNIRGPVRGLWNGAIDRFDFLSQMELAIRRGFEQAWAEGARGCGILPGEYSPEEEAVLRERIFDQLPYLLNFAADIEDNSQANGGKLGALFTRADMWVNRYNEVMNQARVMACGDQKLVWVLGPTEHCGTCLRLAGKVKRASQWMAHPLQPQSRLLECGGFRCQCSLQPTDAPMSKGPLPSKEKQEALSND